MGRESFLSQISRDWRRTKEVGLAYQILDELVQGGKADHFIYEKGSWNYMGTWIGRGAEHWWRRGTGQVLRRRQE